MAGLQAGTSAASSLVEEGLYTAAVLWETAGKCAGKQAVPPSGWFLFYLLGTEDSITQGL